MSKLFDLLYTLIGKVNAAVKTEAQILTAEQKAQARANIGAAAEGSGGGSGISVQGNLEQNDPTQPDYIKGRTHWVEGEPLLLRQVDDLNFDNILGFDIRWDFNLVLYLGKRYIAAWNGVEYECVAQNDTWMNTPGISISTPAFKAFEMWDSGGGAGFAVAPKDGSLSATFALYEDTRTVHKLHPRFLPDGVPYSEGGVGEILPELTAEFARGDLTGAGEVILPSVLDLVEGKTYTVTWDGERYECVCKRLAGDSGGTYMEALILGNAAVFGDYDIGEPFIVGTILQPMNIGMAISLLDYATHTVRVEGAVETVHKLDNKYLDLDWLPTTKLGDEIVAETVVTGDTAGLGGKGGFLDGFGYENHDLYNGRKFNVYFDGVPYTTSVLNFYDPAEVSIFAGNLGLVNLELPNTGEPFVIQFRSDDAFIIWFGGAESHTVSVFDLAPNRMPAEFLPDNAAVFHLTSPNGTKYALTVGDDGALSVTPA